MENQSDATSTNYFKTASNVADIGVHIAATAAMIETVAYWRYPCYLTEDLRNELTQIIREKGSPTEKGVDDMPAIRRKMKYSCDKLAKCHKDFYNVSNMLKEALGGTSVNVQELKYIREELNSVVTGYLEGMLRMELLKSSAQLANMINQLRDTLSLIQESNQYCESSQLQQTREKEIKNKLDTVDKACKEANEDILRLQNTPRTRLGQETSATICNLKRVKGEIESVQNHYNTIMTGISGHLQKLSSARNKHVVGTATSAVTACAAAFQFFNAPSSILSSLAIVLFGATSTILVGSTIGHSLGVYWIYEKIHKLKELQHEMKETEDQINDSFQKIDCCTKTLREIQECPTSARVRRQST